jgi:hypothetical protein
VKFYCMKSENKTFLKIDRSTKDEERSLSTMLEVIPIV